MTARQDAKAQGNIYGQWKGEMDLGKMDELVSG